MRSMSSRTTTRKSVIDDRKPTFKASMCVGAFALTLPLLAQAASPSETTGSVESYLDLPLQDLLSMEVTTVSKKEQSISETAAAVFVITQEDIRRSGVTSIPELLRAVPGFQVAQVDANTWAISSRGFNNIFANKLLVLIDGRTVYTPSFSGVYWDIQDTLLEDVERIEVIRGPGATLWGANAVNGIVNIITKDAADTHAGLATLGAGSEDRGILALRYGGPLGERTNGRIYAKYLDRGGVSDWATGDNVGDDWQATRAGFRVDGELHPQRRWTLQGDIYQQDHDQTSNLWQTAPPFLVTADDSAESSGWNLLARWEEGFSDTASASLQIYFDHTERDEIILEQRYDTLDIDFQHRFAPAASTEIVWGLGYRHIEDKFENTFNVTLTPDAEDRELWSAFMQAEFSFLEDQVRLTLGSKFEDNDYTGIEYQPSIRLLWAPNEQHSVWGAVSRAVRTPSRVEDSGAVVTAVTPIGFPPGFAVVTTSRSNRFESEKLIAYELGYRITNSRDLSFDAAAFFNRYDELRSIEFTSPTTIAFDNKANADSYGLELAVDWRPQDWWRLQTTYTWLKLDLGLDSDSSDTITTTLAEGANPEHQWSLRSSMNLARDWEFDLWAYYVDRVPVASALALSQNIEVEAYVSLNARIAWRPRKNLELSLIGRNLLDPEHLEYVDDFFSAPAEIERSIYGQLQMKF